MKATHLIGSYLWQKIENGHVVLFNRQLINIEKVYQKEISILNFNDYKPIRITSYCAPSNNSLSEIFHREYYKAKQGYAPDTPT